MITFENNNLKYGYDFDALTVEQVELAREVANFKAEQQKTKAKDINELIHSGGASWLSKMCSYLISDIDENGNLKQWEPKTQNIIEQFVKKLPAKEHTKLSEVANDFFQCTGIGLNALSLSPQQGNNDTKATLFEALKHLQKNAMLKSSEEG